MIRVRFFASAAQAAGQREVEGNWAGLTAGELVQRLQTQFPGLGRVAAALAIAINHEYAEPSRTLADGDEVALIPPVSGGDDPLASDATGRFEVVSAPLSADAVAAKVVDPANGAVLLFVGTVREWTRGHRTVLLEYEAYPEMAVVQMQAVAGEIEKQWPGTQTAISHRVGRLNIGEASVIIATATPHRDHAYAANRHAIERLKQIVPIWKKEVWADGEEWVGAQAGPDWMHPELNQKSEPQSQP